MKALKVLFLAAGALILLQGFTFAQKPNDPLKVVMSASKIVLSNGSETRQSAKEVKPGDIVEYSVDYTNESSAALRDVHGVLPIPVGTSYQTGTASPAKFSASTDGKNFSTVPLMRHQKSADGSEKEVPVPPDEYRALRWEIGAIAPKSTVTVRARVKINTTAPGGGAHHSLKVQPKN